MRAGRRPRAWFVLGGLVIMTLAVFTRQKNPAMLAAGLVGAPTMSLASWRKGSE